MKRIYLDHAAATPISPKALKATIGAMKKYPANPSGIHREGRDARAALEGARANVAGALSAHADEIIFTSGATESNNLAIIGVVRAAIVRGVARPHVIISAIEHPSVLEVVHRLKADGVILADILGVNEQGLIDTRELRKIIRPDTVLVSVMYANNEIGTIEPVAYIAKEVRHARKINKSVYPFLHTDASQAANYLNMNVLQLGVDLMTLSSQKTYGPRGIGALFVRRGVPLQSIMHGGKHENGRRPGTESTALALGFATALTESRAMATKESKRILSLRNVLSSGLLKKIKNVSINGGAEESLPNILNIAVDGAEGDALVLYLDAVGVAVSGQSACKSSEDGPSHVIMAIGKVGENESGAIRFSLGRGTTRADIAHVIAKLPPIVDRLREMRSRGDQ